MKAFFFSCFFFFFLQASSQQFDHAFVQLNSGGQIHAVLEDSINQIIYIAGNFTSVNGISRRNLAAIDAQSYALINTFNPVASMSGEILCMARFANKLYIGGNFTSMNGNTAYAYFRRFDLTPSGTGATHSTMFNPGTSVTIQDMCADGTVLYAGGSGLVVDDALSGDFRLGFAAIDGPTGNYLSFDPASRISNAGLNWASLEIVKIHSTNNRIYLCGRNFGGAGNDGIIAIDKVNGDFIPSFNPVFSFECVVDCETRNGKIYVLNSKIWPDGFSLMEFDEASSAMSIGAFTFGGGNPESIALYSDQLFIAGTFTSLQGMPCNYFGGVDLDQLLPLNFLPQPNVPVGHRKALHLRGNKLLLSNAMLTNVASNTVNGASQFCLKPSDPGSILIGDTVWCPNENGILVSLSPVKYAANYQWNFSGSGVQISGTGNSVSIAVSSHPLPGYLSVFPLSDCGIASDTVSVYISFHTPPLADAGADTSFTCYNDTIVLFNSLSDPQTRIQWNYPSGGLVEAATCDAFIGGDYRIHVLDTLSGCFADDTVFVYADTALPDIQLPVLLSQLDCNNSGLLLSGNSSTPATVFYWRQQGASVYSDPFICTAPGQYYLVGTNLLNGCCDSSFLFVTQNIETPDLFLSHPFAATYIADTLTCNDTSLLFVVDALQNGISYVWESPSGNSYSGDSVLVSASGEWKVTGTDSINGCVSDLLFFVVEDLQSPVIAMVSDTFFTNCSVDSVWMNFAQFNSMDSIWIADASGTLFNYPSALRDTGHYQLHVMDRNNFCVSSESFVLAHRNQIEFAGASDTMLCRGTTLAIEPQAIYTGTLSYSALSGTLYNDSIPAFQIGSDTLIQILAESGLCSGVYALQVTLPPERYDSVWSFASCDSSFSLGTIHLQSFGGLPPFLYAANGQALQNSLPLNANLGMNQIVIVDSLGCSDTLLVEVLPESTISEPEFMVDYFSHAGDTLLLINTSIPIADSCSWQFPPELTYIYSDAYSIALHFPDSGLYAVELTNYISGCVASVTREISIREEMENQLYPELFRLEAYPNPTHGGLHVVVQSGLPLSFRIELLRSDGTLLLSENFSETHQLQQFYQIPFTEAGVVWLRCISSLEVKTLYIVLIPE